MFEGLIISGAAILFVIMVIYTVYVMMIKPLFSKKKKNKR